MRTPLRASFFGGGTDLPFFYREEGGSVLGVALDKYTYVVLKDRFDDLVYANWMKKEIVDDTSQLEHDLMREALGRVGLRRGVEITTLSDVPATGTGLGSSSSITVGLLLAAAALRGSSWTQEQLAQEACRIEIDVLRKPIGKQDQYFAAYGGILALRFARDDSVDVQRIDFAPGEVRALEERLLLFYTGVARQADEVLTAVRDRATSSRADLVRLGQMASEGETALRARDWASFGALLDEAWQRKRTLAPGVTTTLIDSIYSRAIGSGALGGKVTGAGGGGFVLLFVEPGERDRVRAALPELREVPFRIAPHGATVVYLESAAG